jgi:hypothetical protein
MSHVCGTQWHYIAYLNSQQPKLCPQEDYLQRERERDRCLGELAFIELPFLLERGERERDLIIIFYLKLFFYYFYLYQK